VTADEALRIVGLASQAEIALVRRDGVAGPLLAQAARAAAGRAGGEALASAARLARAVDISSRDEGPAACRKVVQALCRLALQEAQAAVLEAQ